MEAVNSKVLSLILIILTLIFSATANSVSENFLQCFCSRLQNPNPISDIISAKNCSAFSIIYQSSIQNLRFWNISIAEPEFIITPFNESHIQAAVVCAKNSGMQIRARSGGHDYEGLSYVSYEQFVLIDLVNLNSISVDIQSETAWVQSGATLGELYYKIAEKSNVHGFPAGSCPTVGVGGHISGGGFGTIFREHGLAADNVIDAKIVDVNGRILDKKSMGEDLFWAIRGGGGASFAVIFAWKVKMVSVPPTVTVFKVGKTIEDGGHKLIQKWQNIGHKLDKYLFIHAVTDVVDCTNCTSHSNKTVLVSFVSLFLGDIDKLFPLVQESFPELGLKRNACKEMSWIQSVLYFAGFSTKDPIDVLLNRTAEFKEFSKAKSDYVQQPISETGLQGLYTMLLEEEMSILILTPYGGRMSEILDSETPFPHRSGNLYKIQYIVTWDAEEETEKHLGWMRRLYAYMEPYVSKSPRAAYLNYRDLDLGRNGKGNSSLAQASTWGLKYFKHNFNRLIRVKTATDPSNFFRDEQSIPVILKKN